MSNTPISTVVDRPAVKINGTPISTVMDGNLTDTRVELVMNGTSQATLRFFDADFKLLDDTAISISAAIEISFPSPSGTMTPVFEGEIVGIATDQGPDDLHDLVVTCFDLAHRMSRSTQIVAYQQISYGDLVRRIIGRAGLKAEINGNFNGKHQHLTQATDDCSFLSAIAERTGAQWRVKGKSLVFRGAGVTPTASGATLTWGTNLRRFRTRFNAAEVAPVQVRGWDPMTKKELVADGTAYTSLAAGASARTDGRNGAKNFGAATNKRVDTRQVVTSSAEAKELAAAHLLRSDSTNIAAKGEADGDPTLEPGTTVEVDGVGTRFKGKYYLTSVEHVYTKKGFVTRFTAGTASPSTLVDMLDSPQQRASSAPMIGIVTNNKDPEGLGRVKLKFPVMSDTVESEWARTVATGAGPMTGFQAMPAVNDEVLVVFEGGDLRRPLVLGGLWNGKDKPPLGPTVAGKNGVTVQWQIRTKAGHTLTFDETTQNSENVTILLKDGKTKLYLGVDKIELWANQKNLEIKSGQASVLLANGQDVTIQGVNVTIKAQNALKLDGSTIESVAKATSKVSGAMIEVKASGTATVEASGPLVVKGLPVKIN